MSPLKKSKRKPKSVTNYIFEKCFDKVKTGQNYKENFEREVRIYNFWTELEE